jgi:Tol biopolymer transport system component
MVAPRPVTSTPIIRAAAASTPTPEPVDPNQPSWLYVIDGNVWVAGGKVPQQLTTDGGVSQPALGDGGLAFVERTRNASDIWLASGDAAPRAITRSTAPTATLSHWASQPVFVPARQRLYVVADLNKANTGPGDLAIWEVGLDTSQPLQLTHPPAYSGGDQDVTINPEDARQIIFTRYEYVGAQLVEQLQWLDVTTSRLVALTQNDQAARQASYSPDATEIAFVQHGSAAHEDLYVATLDTSSGRAQLGTPREVATGTIANPVWTPDGTALAYVALTAHGFQLFSVGVMHNASGEETFGPPKQLTEGPSIDATSRPVFLTLEQADEIRGWFATPAS